MVFFDPTVVADAALVELLRTQYSPVIDTGRRLMENDKEEGCTHPWLVCWFGDEHPWRCQVCAAPITDLGKIAEEERRSADTIAEDGDDADINAARTWQLGISPDLLVALCVAFDCWEMPTWEFVLKAPNPNPNPNPTNPLEQPPL